MDIAVLLIGFAGIIAVAKKGVDVITWLFNKDWDSLAKTMLVIVIAVGLLLLLANSVLANMVPVIPADEATNRAQITLDQLDTGAVIYLGIMLGCIAAFGVDIFLRALDNTRSSASGVLVGRSEPEG